MMIEKLLFWNITLVSSQHSFELIDLNKRNKFAYIALMESFKGPLLKQKPKKRARNDK